MRDHVLTVLPPIWFHDQKENWGCQPLEMPDPQTWLRLSGELRKTAEKPSQIGDTIFSDKLMTGWQLGHPSEKYESQLG